MEIIKWKFTYILLDLTRKRAPWQESNLSPCDSGAVLQPTEVYSQASCQALKPQAPLYINIGLGTAMFQVMGEY